MIDLADGPALLIADWKITASHRARHDHAQVRQSTLLQVQVHTESLARQYDLLVVGGVLGGRTRSWRSMRTWGGQGRARRAGRDSPSWSPTRPGPGPESPALEVSRLAR